MRDIFSNNERNVPIANSPIYFNEALTPFNKILLWNAKQGLKEIKI